MGTVRHKLMLQESDRRRASAELLRAAGDNSDSAYLLELLAFELLLKVVVEQSTKSVAHGHKYQDLFALLSSLEQSNILRIAGERIGPSALGTDHKGVLADLGSNFVGLRYPYEKHGNLSQEEYRRVGTAWIATGAQLGDADYRYYPEELLGLIFALRQVAHAC